MLLIRSPCGCAMLVHRGFGGFTSHCAPASPCVFSSPLRGVGCPYISFYNLGLYVPMFKANLNSVLCRHEAHELRPLGGLACLACFCGQQNDDAKRLTSVKGKRRQQRAEGLLLGKFMPPAVVVPAALHNKWHVWDLELRPGLFLTAQESCWLQGWGVRGVKLRFQGQGREKSGDGITVKLSCQDSESNGMIL